MSNCDFCRRPIYSDEKIALLKETVVEAYERLGGLKRRGATSREILGQNYWAACSFCIERATRIIGTDNIPVELNIAPTTQNNASDFRSLSDSGDRSEPRGKARPLYSQFKGNSRSYLTKRSRIIGHCPTSRIDHSRVRQAPSLLTQSGRVVLWVVCIAIIILSLIY